MNTGLAVAGGLSAAVVFAAVTLCNARSARLIGPGALLGWIMPIGLLVVGPVALAGGVPERLDDAALGWMVVAGVGDVGGLLLAYAALANGKVGVVAPIVATQGAVAATIAAVAGEPLPAGAGLALA
ncbi:MAG: EamA family transporter, partial [Pseudonocardia sp.]